MIPYDMDQMFTGTNDNLFRQTGVAALQRLFNHPDIIPRYYAQILDLMDNDLAEERIRPALEQMLGDVVPREPDRIDPPLHRKPCGIRAKPNPIGADGKQCPARAGWYSADQRWHVGPIDRPVQRDPDAIGAGRRSGGRLEPAHRHLEHLGRAAAPGREPNPCPGHGRKRRRNRAPYVDILRNTGTTQAVASTITSDTTWTADQGPYRVSGGVTVAEGAMLTIEPGTSVYFDVGARMTIRGRLHAEGTEQQHIRLTRVPGNGASWNGLQFADSMQDNVISYAVIEHASTDDGSVGLDRSRIELDHVVFGHAFQRRIRTIDSSLVVRNSLFTDISPPGQPPLTNNLSEHIWGSGIPAGGEFILENNFFGHITGHNDGIDFDAPRRPTDTADPEQRVRRRR